MFCNLISSVNASPENTESAVPRLAGTGSEKSPAWNDRIQGIIERPLIMTQMQASIGTVAIENASQILLRILAQTQGLGIIVCAQANYKRCQTGNASLMWHETIENSPKHCIQQSPSFPKISKITGLLHAVASYQCCSKHCMTVATYFSKRGANT